MHSDRSYRGWVVTVTVAGIVTYFVLAVEKDFSLHGTQTKTTQPQGRPAGIWLESDPTLALSPQNKPSPIQPTQIANARSISVADNHTAHLLSLPPEPVASVVLHAPKAIPEMVALTLMDAKNNDKLITALDNAFESPIREVSHQKPQASEPQVEIDQSRLAALTPTSVASGIMAEPTALLRQLANLRNHTVPMQSVSFTSTTALRAVEQWSEQVEGLVRQIVYRDGLQHSRTPHSLENLLALTAQAHQITAQLEPVQHASRLGAVAYATERRARIWMAVAACLQNSDSPTTPLAMDRQALLRLNELTSQIIADLQGKADGEGWIRFLRLEELRQWSSQPTAQWQEGNELATSVLTRLNWERLTHAQRAFITGAAFDRLSSLLSPWATQPVDFRQLMSDLEQLEEDPINRCRTSLAHTVQTLRVSAHPSQRGLAEAINDHYRNANIRLAISGRLLERMMPSETFQARPVRQRILGADTRGSSQVRTSLSVQLIPDPTAWHLKLGVDGDMQSDTRSSKGPAAFYQTGVAKISSARTMRMDPNGIKVTADPTNVDTSQSLNAMSTDLDRLPVVGDFFRAMVREQFEQQRGVAQRITRRLIAEETDVEVDKQLKQRLAGAESQLQHTFIGPLERLGLNPVVVAMNTTDERMTIRYRVASDNQMAAHTPRPRAPGDSLVSMQIHQSAINNALSQLGLNDKTWTLPELCDKLADAFDQAPWVLPEDAPRDVTVQFAPTRPITVELNDGKLEMTLRIAQLTHPERKMSFERFIIRVSYVPVADGLRAGLVRDGVVSVDGPRLSFTEKIPLRGIFGTVFSPGSSLNLVHQQWLNDPRAEGLAVSQVEVRDGWLSIAVSEANSPHAAHTAAQAREIESLTR